MSHNSAASGTPPLQWFGHPRGLFILFMTEMWERFSFYGMRALLIFYLLQHFLIDKSLAYAHYAAYAALVYLGSLVGGLVADRYLGFRKAVTFGAILLTIGHGLMALDDGRPSHKFLASFGQSYQIISGVAAGPSGDKPEFLLIGSQQYLISSQARVGGEDRLEIMEAPGHMRQMMGRISVVRDPLTYNLLFLALAFIVVGVGFMKSNISTLLGRLYGAGDTRRDRGFTIFYMGINIGAFLSSSICGYVGIAYGWSYGFGLAGIGMALGLIIFQSGIKYLEGKGEPPDPALLGKNLGLGLTREVLVYAFSLALIAGTALLLRTPDFAADLLNGTSLGVITFLFFYLLFKVERGARRQLLVVCILIFSAVISWMLMEQAPASLNVFTADFVDLHFGNFHLPAPVLQNLEPFFLILFAIPISFLWAGLEGRRIYLSPLTKTGLGFIIISLGYLGLSFGIHHSLSAPFVGLEWIVLIYFMCGISELCWAPVGLAAVTQLSPPTITGFLVGAWFLAAAYGGKLAGWVSQMTVVPGGGRAQALGQYAQVYLWLGVAALVCALFMFAISPMLRVKAAA